jgi:transcriptional regulator with XRE-family HTH domain
MEKPEEDGIPSEVCNVSDVGGDAPLTLGDALTQAIRELMIREGWTQRALAKRLGVTQGAISFLLAAKRHTSGLVFLERLAKVFGKSLSELIYDLEVRVAASTRSRVSRREAPAHNGAPYVAGPSTSSEEERILAIFKQEIRREITRLYQSFQIDQQRGETLGSVDYVVHDAGATQSKKRANRPRGRGRDT